MKFNALAVAAVTALSSLGANAALTDLGALDSVYATSFSGVVTGKGPFTDLFTFTLAETSNVSFSLSNLPVVGMFNTVLASASLYSNADNNVFSSDDTLLSPNSSITAPIGSAFNALDAGSYYLQVAGITNGNFGGIYNGSLSVSSVSAVPEPETYAMLLAGLGLMGAIARRRNQKDAS